MKMEILALRMSGKELCFYDRGQKDSINIQAKNNFDVSTLAINDKDGKNSITLSCWS